MNRRTACVLLGEGGQGLFVGTVFGPSWFFWIIFEFVHAKSFVIAF